LPCSFQGSFGNVLVTYRMSHWAIVCRCDGSTAIHRWVRNRDAWLGKHLTLANSIPFRDCIRRLLLALKPEAFQQCSSATVDMLRHVGGALFDNGIVSASRMISGNGLTWHEVRPHPFCVSVACVARVLAVAGVPLRSPLSGPWFQAIRTGRIHERIAHQFAQRRVGQPTQPFHEPDPLQKRDARAAKSSRLSR
jgi:hypothetical protein